MRLTYREGRPEDFEDWFAMECLCFSRGTKWRGNAKWEWDALFQSPGFLTLVLEESEGLPQPRMAGFGAGAFVSDAFVDWLAAKQAPYVLIHATNPLPDGSSPLLNRTELCAANSGDGLNFLLTHWTWAAPRLDEKQIAFVRSRLAELFHWMHGGYNLKSFLSEGFGVPHRDRSLASGFMMLNDYRDYYCKNPEKFIPSEYPSLMIVTRDSVKDGSAMARSFAYTPPRFRFTPRQQEILRLARQGKSNSEIRACFAISETAFKAHWLRIYERVESAQPDLLPDPLEDPRRIGARAALVHYLQSHPEELRPHHALIAPAKR